MKAGCDIDWQDGFRFRDCQEGSGQQCLQKLDLSPCYYLPFSSQHAFSKGNGAARLKRTSVGSKQPDVQANPRGLKTEDSTHRITANGVR